MQNIIDVKYKIESQEKTFYAHTINNLKKEEQKIQKIYLSKRL